MSSESPGVIEYVTVEGAYTEVTLKLNFHGVVTALEKAGLVGPGFGVEWISCDDHGEYEGEFLEVKLIKKVKS
jgi:hypothetical protein